MRHSNRMSSTPSLSDLGAITVVSVGPRIVLTKFVGRTNEGISKAAEEEFARVVEPMDRPVWISDASRLTGFDPRTLALGQRWFKSFKARGGRDCLVVSSWDIAMMAARTMALGLGVRIASFPSYELAHRAALQLLARNEP